MRGLGKLAMDRVLGKNEKVSGVQSRWLNNNVNGLNCTPNKQKWSI